MHVIDHTKGQPSEGESRNVLTESARIARGKITDLANLSAANHDAAIFPGGFGAAKNLSTFAVDGKDCKVNKEVERVLKEFHQAGKPIGLPQCPELWDTSWWLSGIQVATVLPGSPCCPLLRPWLLDASAYVCLLALFSWVLPLRRAHLLASAPAHSLSRGGSPQHSGPHRCACGQMTQARQRLLEPLLEGDSTLGFHVQPCRVQRSRNPESGQRESHPDV
eukprot:XP_016884005.1 uncharacterized protein GATD3B isoform X5 [Homo sapiens]